MLLIVSLPDIVMGEANRTRSTWGMGSRSRLVSPYLCCLWLTLRASIEPVDILNDMNSMAIFTVNLRASVSGHRLDINCSHLCHYCIPTEQQCLMSVELEASCQVYC